MSGPAVDVEVGGCPSEDAAAEGASDWTPPVSVNKTVWEAAAYPLGSLRS